MRAGALVALFVAADIAADGVMALCGPYGSRSQSPALPLQLVGANILLRLGLI